MVYLAHFCYIYDMKSYIIGIAGKKNSGKDTVASMINYIFAKGITAATYRDWLLCKESYDATYKHRITHFADALKDCLSIIYHIPRQYFDDREYKDNMYYNLRTGEFIRKEKVTQRGDHYFVIENGDVEHSSIREEIEWNDKLLPLITLRTLMQYFGTNLCRECLQSDIWIKATMAKASDICLANRLCIIPDVRFTNEATAIQTKTPSLYGGVIMVRHDNNSSNDDIDYHSSEIVTFSTDYSITNNGTLMDLFYKVIEICQKIILQ